MRENERNIAKDRVGMEGKEILTVKGRGSERKYNVGGEIKVAREEGENDKREGRVEARKGKRTEAGRDGGREGGGKGPWRGRGE